MKSPLPHKFFIGNACRKLCAVVRVKSFCAVAILCAAAPIAIPQATNQLSEASVKAAFLYKFISFIEWPHELPAERPIKFGVVGSEIIASELRTLVANRRVDGHPVAVINVQRPSDLEDVQVLFIGRPAMTKMASLLPEADKKNIVVVTEATEALARGSAINFVLVDGHVRFEVSLRAAKRAGFKLSSRLLAVAKSVEPEPQ